MSTATSRTSRATRTGAGLPAVTGPRAAAPRVGSVVLARRRVAPRVTSGRVPPARPARLVLTSRGRRLLRAAVLVLTTAVVAALLVLVWLGAAASVAPGAAAGDGEPGVVSGAAPPSLTAEATDPVEVVVRPGDTLWHIALSTVPGRDPRSVVADIVRINELPSTAVAAGAVLVVPAS